MRGRGDLGSSSEQWIQCAKCKKILFKPEFERALRVCNHCAYHHKLRARERIAITVDTGSFIETDANLLGGDPLQFPEYSEKLQKGRASSGENEAVITGTASVESHSIVLGVMDFGFMGGSMGSVVGEKIVRCFEHGLNNRLPVVLFCASGGARMQEGLISLMQMAKTTAAVARFQRSNMPYLAVFTDPTMAGVLAGFASLPDIILAEPGALVGFAGQRVAAQAGVGKAPSNFQTAEFQMEHGMIDLIVTRREVRPILGRLLEFFVNE
jgi:acetyl-CoA carboxylase carboxyl transferase subunit beta